jgi:hypothetical protein
MNSVRTEDFFAVKACKRKICLIGDIFFASSFQILSYPQNGCLRKSLISQKGERAFNSGIDMPSAGSQQDPPLFSNNSFNSQVRLQAEYFLNITN